MLVEKSKVADARVFYSSSSAREEEITGLCYPCRPVRSFVSLEEFENVYEFPVGGKRLLPTFGCNYWSDIKRDLCVQS